MCHSILWTYPYGLCPTRECVCIPFCLFWTKQPNRPPSGNRSLKKLAWRKSRPKPLTLSRHADAAHDFLAWFSTLFSRSLLPKSFSFKSFSLSRKSSFVNFLDMVASEPLPPFENTPQYNCVAFSKLIRLWRKSKDERLRPPFQKSPA